MPARVDDPVRAATDPQHRAGPEPAHLQRGDVEVGDPRVAGVQHLEAAVDDEAVDPLGRQPPAGVPAGLEHVDVAPGVGQADGGRQPGQAGTDHDDLGASGHGHVPNLVKDPAAPHASQARAGPAAGRAGPPGEPVDDRPAGDRATAPPTVPPVSEDETPVPAPSRPSSPATGWRSCSAGAAPGEVWRAVPRGGGEPVAVKVLVAGDPERQAREAALLGELDHPHLVRLVEVVHQPRRGGRARVALVLELLDGGSLAALLARRGRLRPGEVVTAVAPVAAALAHAHAAGVVHGDLSPGNVVFTAEGRPVLTDLGVARVLGEEAAGEVTPPYVDPTVARGGAPGPASDVFGVAAAAFHALTGIAPWNAATPADTLAVAAAGELPDLDLLAPEAPPALRDVIGRGLAADPSDRPTAAEFALDLRHACRAEPVRLPVAGVPDAELGRTGRGPRTELTHQVARRAPAGSGSGSRRRPSRLRLPAGRWAAGGRGAAGRRRAAGRGERGRCAVGGDGCGAGVRRIPVVDRAGASAGPRPRAPETDWLAVVAELYARRAEAFTRADPAGLDAVYAPGSPLRAADEAAVRALADAGQRLTGFAPRVEGPALAIPAGDAVRIEARDGWAGYAVVPADDPDGPPLARAPGPGDRAGGPGARPRAGRVADRRRQPDRLSSGAGQSRPSAARSAEVTSGWVQRNPAASSAAGTAR